LTTANAILILAGIVAVAIILSKILGSLDNLRALFSWRGLASSLVAFAAGFLLVAFYGTGKYSPIFPVSPFRYFAWMIALVLFFAAIWIGLPRRTKVWIRRNKTGVVKQIRDAHHKDD